MRPLAKRKPQREPTIALINVVFLMLVFFMVAGTLAQPVDKGLTLVKTADLEGRTPPNALVIHADGTLSHQGAPIANAADFVTTLPQEARATLRVIPDRALPAQTLVALSAELRLAGAERVVIVTERGLK